MAEVSMFLQLAENKDTWDEVDQYLWDNWQKAMRPNGKQRYTGNRVMKNKNGISVEATDLSCRELAIVARFVGVKENDCPPALTGGFIRKPEFVRIKSPTNRDKDRVVLHEVFGTNFAKVPVPKTSEETETAEKVVVEKPVNQTVAA